jgi:hypothetical protein
VDEQRTAAILVELRRLGVDLGLLSGPLVGTGLRASELLDWLRGIPDGVGPDDLLRRLDEYARANALRPLEIRWRAVPSPTPHRYPRERWWPTQELLDVGTDLLLEEWDPFGVRLAGTDRETIAMFAFHFFGPLLSPNGMADPITHTTEMIASAERDHLALRPSPESHRRYLARRLAELVLQYPIPRLTESQAQPKPFVVMRGPPQGAPPALDPEGVCARCHGFGTVARVTTVEQPAGWTKRYCAACWPVIRAEDKRRLTRPETAADQVAFLDGSLRPPTETESRSWDDVRDLIQMFTTQETGGLPPSAVAREHYAELARNIVHREPGMDGPMPADVVAFVQQYAHA